MALANAVFEGGGVRGIGLVGALAVAEQKGYTWGRVAGTSAGSIVATLVAAGYSANEIQAAMNTKIDFKAFMDGGPPGSGIIAAAVDVVDVLRHKGIYKGQYAIEIMDELLTDRLHKTPVTFRDLPVRCQVIASDVTNRRMVVLPDDLKEYGMDDPLAFPVSHAVRASISIPIFFEPYLLTYPAGQADQTATLVDGGLLSNFPVWLFDPPGGVPEIPTFGFLLQVPGTTGPWPTHTLMEFLHAMVSTVLDGRDTYDLTHQDYERTIIINTGDIKTTDFDLTAAQRDWLFRSGQQAGEQFFADFSFASWLDRFSHRASPRQAP